MKFINLLENKEEEKKMNINSKQGTKQNNQKSNSKIIIPAVMSMSLLATSFLAGGVSASEGINDKNTQLNHSIESSVNHGYKVSTAARGLPGSAGKGMIIRSIAKKNVTEEVVDEDLEVDENQIEDEDLDTDVDEVGAVDEEGTADKSQEAETEAGAETSIDIDVTDGKDEETETGAETAIDIDVTDRNDEETETDAETAIDIDVTDGKDEETEADAETAIDIDVTGGKEEETEAGAETAIDIDVTDGKNEEKNWISNSYLHLVDSYKSLIEYYNLFLSNFFSKSVEQSVPVEEETTVIEIQQKQK